MRTSILAGLAGLAALAACSDGGPGTAGSVAVGFATEAGAPAGPAFAESITDSSGNTLTIDSAAVVIRKLHLRGGVCAGDDDEGEDTSAVVPMMDEGNEIDEDENECPPLRLGPMLVDLTLDGGISHSFTVSVDTGTYTAVHFQIHKPSGDRDAEFLAAHPEYEGVSIRVVGTYNGTPFVYTTGVTDVQRMRLRPPLVVGDGIATLTVKVDLSGWFKGGSGALIDPATAIDGGPNAWIVHHNIVRSFRCFEDHDHDGHDDHEGQGGGDD